MAIMRYFEINDLSPDERRVLAKKVNAGAIYLWQCGAGIRVPSLPLAGELIRYEKRLTVRGLLAPYYRRQGKPKKPKKGVRK